MLLKPLSQNVFLASLLLVSALMISWVLAEPIFGTVMDTPAAQDMLRQVVVPLFRASGIG